MTISIVTPKTFLAYSLGCRTNQSEIESISLQLINHGFKQLDLSTLPLFYSPALILLNTCVVTQKAEKETRQKIRELRKKYPKSFLVVLGCAVDSQNKFKISLPEADLFISNVNKSQTSEIIKSKINTLSHDREVVCHEPYIDIPGFAFTNKYILSGRKFIKIQDGCDKFCSYCITAHLRGKPTNVPPEKIIKEINFWVEKGIKEIILTGINIGLYSSIDRYDTCQNTCQNIANLLKRILSETKIERLTLSSIYPEMLTDGFLKLVVGNPRITQSFHLSLQSGSPTVLERMNRKTDLKKLAEKLSWIKKQNPYFTFRADIITGFPNETEKKFQETLNFIKETKISFAHIFTFSPRKGTVAYEMIKSKKWNEVSGDIKKERVEKIKNVVEEVRNNEAKKIIGIIFDCLIVRLLSCLPSEALAKLGYLAGGITENGWPIKISIKYPSFAKAMAGKQVLSIKGKILPVKITGFEGNYLLGEITSLPTN